MAWCGFDGYDYGMVWLLFGMGVVMVVMRFMVVVWLRHGYGIVWCGVDMVWYGMAWY